METYLGLNIDRSRDNLFDKAGLQRLKDGYMKEDEESPQQRFAFVAKMFGTNEDHSQRLYDYASKHWLSFSTPILSIGKAKRSLPISCFLPFLEDTSEGLVDTLSETNWLSMLGGGVGIYFGIRSSDDKSTGVMPHLKIYDASCLAYRQGKTRRGSYATYLDISHPDILMFIEMRKPTGDQNFRCLNLHHGVNIPDSFMQIIERCMLNPNENDDWELIDPASQKVKEVVSAKYLWQKILETRVLTGEPYLHFIDTSNRLMNRHQYHKGLRIQQSNLCSEITLPTGCDYNGLMRTAVCCLSSLNLEYYDDWKDHELFIQDVAECLDNVLEYFIRNAPEPVANAVYSAKMERSIGIGALGFHAYLQKNHISFESALAKSKNLQIFKLIHRKCQESNLILGSLRGSPEDLKDTGLRFAHMQSIAPNASSSIILGNTSPSIEPFKANAYRQDTLSGAFINRNRFLDKIIRDKCKENKSLIYDEIWSSIISNDGSVQHLEFLDDYTKDVFKTALEIDQRWIIEHASDRQPYIDQAQSLNLFVRPDIHIQYLHALHFSAWKKGLKTLYYLRSEKIGKADKISQQIERHIIEELDMKDLVNDEGCLACE